MLAVRRYLWVVPGIASLVVSYVAYVWFFAKIGYGQHAATLATILLVSVALHELGHWVFMSYYGLDPYMFIAVLFGGAGTAKVKQEEAMKRRKQVNIVLAGPAVNLILLIVGMALGHYTKWDKMGWALASINAGLIVLNLLPFGPLDGGRFARLLFDSVNEKADQAISICGAVLAVLAFLVIVVTGHFSLYPALLVVGLIRASHHDNVNAWRQRKSMDINTSWTVFSVFLATWCLALACYIYVPMWTYLYRG